MLLDRHRGPDLRRHHPALQFRRQRAGTVRQRHPLRGAAAGRATHRAGSDSHPHRRGHQSICACFRQPSDHEYLFEMNMGAVRVVELHARCRARRRHRGRRQSAMRLPGGRFRFRLARRWAPPSSAIPASRTAPTFLSSGRSTRHTIDVRFWERGRGRNQQFRHRLDRRGHRRHGARTGGKPGDRLTPAGPLRLRLEDESLISPDPPNSSPKEFPLWENA